jgi:hypothetical protein
MTKAKANFQRADQLYRSSVRLFYVFALIMLVVIAYQVAHLQNDFTNQQSQAINQRDKDTAAARKRLEDALIETKNQQVVTQQYIRCIASVLLKPINQRTQADFDACGIPGVTDPKQAGKQPTTGSSSTTPAPVAPMPTKPSSQSTQNPPVATAPPPDNSRKTSTAPTLLERMPNIGGLFHALGL